MQAYKEVLARLTARGKEGYLVGGSVRDLLLSREPSDFDVTTNAHPKEIVEIFSDMRVIETGIKHGTVTVLIGGVPVEVTTYRTETGYSDHRHPDAVAYAGVLTEDLSRRDFTVNAMAFSPEGELIDPFGGREDLEKKLIRCVGDPEKRFGEDALRILRALRFSSQLGFRIEEKTARAAEKLAPTLGYVSRERCFSELKKLLCGVDAGRVIAENKTVLSALIPQLASIYGFDQNNPHHVYTLETHISKAVDACPPDDTLRLAALFHDIAKPLTESVDGKGVSHFYGHAQKSAEIAEEVLRALRCDNKTREDVVFLVRHHDAPAEDSEAQVLKKLNRFGAERYRMLLELRRADNAAQAPGYERKEAYDFCRSTLEGLLRARACFSLRDLEIDGNDLLGLGMKPSKEVGLLLSQLLEQVMNGTLANDRGVLLAAAKERIGGKDTE